MTIDFVGDIHGHAAALEALLRQLGYRETAGAWRHPDRHMVFVGDFIDRGPEQLRTIDMVRRMMDAGSARAVMGNHEFNATAWATQDPERPGKFLRVRGSKNRMQHQVFLDAVGNDSELHREVVGWFKTLPLWLEIGGVRVVHACWHPPMQALLAPHLDVENRLTEEGWLAATRKGTDAFKAAEILLKGMEVSLPDGVTFFDEDGIERRRTRTKWWDVSADTYRAAAIVDETTRGRMPDTIMPASDRVPGAGDAITMIGHYWLKSAVPYLTSARVACLDFSVARGGLLASYAYDGEPELDLSKMTSVRADGELEPAAELAFR